MTLLKVWIAGNPFAIPVEEVVMVLMMSRLDPLPCVSPALAGLLTLKGERLPVIDPAPLLGLPPLGAPIRDERGCFPGYPRTTRLLVVGKSDRFALILERIDDLYEVDSEALTELMLPTGVVSCCPGPVWQNQDHSIPILSTPLLRQELRTISQRGAPA